MSFDVAADAYTRFMGRFSEPLADLLVDLVDPAPGTRALDVGCGPGAMTVRLARRLGTPAVVAVDPSAPFVAAVRARLPGLEVHEADAARLPFADAAFDLVVAQLVVHFMPDPVAGLREMRRVTAPGGRLAVDVWDHAGESGPLAAFWRAVRDVDPGAPGEAELPGTRAGDLVDLARAAGWAEVTGGALTVSVPMASFADWWEPFTLGVGPAGSYVAGLDDQARARLARRCADLLPPAPFEVSATAWSVLAGQPDTRPPGGP